jgi:hypothetical protein
MAVVPSIFGSLADSQNMQAVIDNSLDFLNNQSIWRQYLTPGVPSASLTFESVIGRSRIEAAASIVDPGSKKPLRARNKGDVYTGKIPSIRQKFAMSEQDFRTMMMLESVIANPAARKQELMKLLYDDVSKCAVAPDKRVDIMLMQILSTLQVDVSTTNNPDGVAYGTVDLLAQSYQKQGVPVVWSDATNADPFLDIEAFAQKNSTARGRTFGKILVPLELWFNMKKAAKVKAALSTFWGFKNGALGAVTVTTVNEWLVANMLPQIEVVNYTAGIESDGVISTIRPFFASNVAFVPNGIIGTLENAIAVEERHPSPDTTYAMYGRTLVSKWGETDPRLEYTGCELNAFPAVDIDSIAVLTTETVQASFT